MQHEDVETTNGLVDLSGKVQRTHLDVGDPHPRRVDLRATWPVTDHPALVSLFVEGGSQGPDRSSDSTVSSEGARVVEADDAAAPALVVVRGDRLAETIQMGPLSKWRLTHGPSRSTIPFEPACPRVGDSLPEAGDLRFSLRTRWNRPCSVR